MNEEKVNTIAEQPAKESPKEDPRDKRIQELEAELGPRRLMLIDDEHVAIVRHSCPPADRRALISSGVLG